MFKTYVEPELPSEGGVFEMNDEAESPNERACLRYDEPESPSEGDVFKMYMNRNRQMRWACLRYMMNRNRLRGCANSSMQRKTLQSVIP